MKRLFYILCLLLSFDASAAPDLGMIAIDLDSIAETRRFPRFCLNVYRWADKTFNSYDTTYIKGISQPFTIKLHTVMWNDFYNFSFDEKPRTLMFMVSDPNYSGGFWLSYKALSLGYDMNLSKYFGHKQTRYKWSFQFNCSLLSANAYYSRNDVGSTIKRLGPSDHLHKFNTSFDEMNNESWGIDIFYFFNNRRYSQTAAFNFSRIQERSAGSLYLGTSFWGVKYDFNFNKLPDEVKALIPLADYNYHYRTSSDNYGIVVGYGYNWVFHRYWALCASESPVIGVRHGWLLTDKSRYSLSLYNRFTASLVFNKNNFFVGGVASFRNALFYDRSHTMLSSVFQYEFSLGYHFDIRFR